MVWLWREGVPSSFDLSLLGGQGSYRKQRMVLQACSLGDRSSAFGTFAETLRIIIIDVNDNTPVFKAISETFGEQLGLAHHVSSSLHPHMPCCTHQQRESSPSPGQGSEQWGGQAGVTQCFP